MAIIRISINTVIDIFTTEQKMETLEWGKIERIRK